MYGKKRCPPSRFKPFSALRLYLKPWAQFFSYNMNILAGRQVNIGYRLGKHWCQTCIKLVYCIKINLPTQSVLLTICFLHHCLEVKQDLVLIYTRNFFYHQGDNTVD